jgi:hypothetical protein
MATEGLSPGCVPEAEAMAAFVVGGRTSGFHQPKALHLSSIVDNKLCNGFDGVPEPMRRAWRATSKPARGIS